MLTLYHGCPDERRAHAALREGLKPRTRPEPTDQVARDLAPLPGRVYFSQDRRTAIDYARIYARLDWDREVQDGSRGVLFEVSASLDDDLRADEDDLGEAVTVALLGLTRRDVPILDQGNRHVTRAVVADETLAGDLIAAARAHAPAALVDALAGMRLADPRGDLISRLGKRLVRTPETNALQRRLIALKANVSLPAPVCPARAYAISRDGLSPGILRSDLLTPWPESRQSDLLGMRI